MQGIIPFILIGILSLIVSILNNQALIGVIGFTGTYYYMLVWAVSFSSINYLQRKNLFDYYIRLSIIYAVITAIFAIYQYYVDPTIFGVNPSKIYSNIELLDVQYTRRATSFIGSPQNLGIYFGLMTGCLFLVDYNKMIKAVLFLLFISGGILSGSATFVVFMIIFLFIYNYRLSGFKRVNFVKTFFQKTIPLFFVFAVLSIQNIEGLSNTIWQSFYISDRFNSGIFKEYNIDLFFLQNNILGYIFGKGIGIVDRLVEVVTKENLPTNWVNGTESYLIKIFFELGIFGLFSFMIFYLQSLIYSYRDKTVSGHAIFAILVALLSNLLCTPSFTGLTMSFIIWPFILFPVIVFPWIPFIKRLE